MRRRFGLLSGLVLALAASAHGETTLKLNITPGLSYAFDNTMKLDLNLGLSAGGQQMNIQQKLNQFSSGTIEVLEATGGKTTKAKITFAPTCGGSQSAMGQEQKMPFALAGKTITATVNGDAVDIQPTDGVDEDTRKAVAELLKGDSGLYPDKPVNVGDEWNGSLGGAELKSNMKFKLDKISKVNGRDVAEISASGQIQGNENGMNMAGDVKGPVLMDVETGLVASAEVAGDLKIDGNMVQGGNQIVVNGTGTMGVTAKNVVAGAGVTPPPVAPNPVGNNPVGGPPVPAVALAGAYAGDGLTMNVTGDDVALELGASKLAGKITKRDGANLAGTFTHDGKSFDFKAVVNGDAVDFTTGTKTYKLKKQGAANPLG